MLISYSGFEMVHIEKAYSRLKVNTSFPFLHVELTDALFVMKRIS